MTYQRLNVAAVALFFFSAQISGQSLPPFRTLQFGVQIVEPTQANSLHGYWDPERGLEAMITTPFYWGDILAGVQIMSFSAADSSYPNFESIYPFLGWEVSLLLPFQLRLHTGLNLGINRMEFDNLTEFERTESEVGLTLLIGFSRLFAPNLTVRSSIRRESIFTYERIHLLQYTVGLGYTIQTPQGIKKLLE